MVAPAPVRRQRQPCPDRTNADWHRRQCHQRETEVVIAAPPSHHGGGDFKDRAPASRVAPATCQGCRDRCRRLARGGGRPPEHQSALPTCRTTMRPEIGASVCASPRSRNSPGCIASATAGLTAQTRTAPPAADSVVRPTATSWPRQHRRRSPPAHRRRWPSGAGALPTHPPAQRRRVRRWHKWRAHRPATATGHDKRQSAATPTVVAAAANFATVPPVAATARRDRRKQERRLNGWQRWMKQHRHRVLGGDIDRGVERRSSARTDDHT